MIVIPASFFLQFLTVVKVHIFVARDKGALRIRCGPSIGVVAVDLYQRYHIRNGIVADCCQCVASIVYNVELVNRHRTRKPDPSTLNMEYVEGFGPTIDAAVLHTSGIVPVIDMCADLGMPA